MGIIESIFGKKELESKEGKILKFLIHLNTLQANMKAGYPTEEPLENESISKLLPKIKEYNQFLKSTTTILLHLDKKIADKMKDFYLPETITFLKISQKSNHSLFNRLDISHKELSKLIRTLEVKQREEIKKAA